MARGRDSKAVADQIELLPKFATGLKSEEIGLERVRNFEMPCYYVAPIYPHKYPHNSVRNRRIKRK